ncbi:MAG: hypothetical protein COB85_06590 [Bacteroidetes bacterium]|nr:MAG: hypothetical protein COB85_06590 [Bacteroidota bacterium]
METQETSAIQTTFNVSHEVADFEKWHAIYLDTSDADARIGVLRNVDNPNMVFVGERTESHTAAREEMNSEELHAAMKEAGVTSKPVVRLLNMVVFQPVGTDANYRVSVTHEVADFDKWRVLFDADNERRESAGVFLTGLGSSEDNPAEVFMMFATSDIEKAKTIFNDPELKEKMQEAGVTSAPEFNYWKMF